MTRVFKSAVIQEQLTVDELKGIEGDFRSYKETGILPDTFGRDELYDHPSTLPSVRQEEISHVHLSDGDTPWPVHKIQFQRTSDTHLVYCQGALNDDCFLLMVILAPNAHELARKRDQMWKLAEMAEKFRDQF